MVYMAETAAALACTVRWQRYGGRREIGHSRRQRQQRRQQHACIALARAMIYVTLCASGRNTHHTALKAHAGGVRCGAGAGRNRNRRGEGPVFASLSARLSHKQRSVQGGTSFYRYRYRTLRAVARLAGECLICSEEASVYPSLESVAIAIAITIALAIASLCTVRYVHRHTCQVGWTVFFDIFFAVGLGVHNKTCENQGRNSRAQLQG